MEELIARLQAQAGLTEAQATQAATIFINFVKSKLPDALHGTVDSVLSYKGTVADQAKDKVRQFSGEVEETARDWSGKVANFFNKKSES
ncbi:MAG TPA: hypothetical protein VMV20_01500 [Chitinophagaceae bacterium]|nr:hypothetical protein [Chitinophagaceae bacterium]